MANYEKSEEALLDWREIIEYTINRFGEQQALKYSASLITCIESMTSGNQYFKVIDVNGRKVGVKHCHKHYIFALIRENRPLLVFAIFHERMDLMVRLKNRLN